MTDALSGIVFLTRSDLATRGCALTTKDVHEAAARAWAEIRSGAARGGKAVLSLPEDEFWSVPDFTAFKPDFCPRTSRLEAVVSL